jgi:phosphoglycolate phosphatase-like HAD superfamily hydrolase
MTKPKAIIFDIDGTLANVDHRRHFVDGTHGKKDFNKFYEVMDDDGVHWDIVELLHMYHLRDYKIIICTGRPEEYRKVTELWLHGLVAFAIIDTYSDEAKSNISPEKGYHKLLMRPDDRRHEPDYLIKQDMLNELRKDYDIKLAIDDRDQVVKMWRENGIRCLQVAEGDF